MTTTPSSTPSEYCSSSGTCKLESVGKKRCAQDCDLADEVRFLPLEHDRRLGHRTKDGFDRQAMILAGQILEEREQHATDVAAMTARVAELNVVLKSQIEITNDVRYQLETVTASLLRERGMAEQFRGDAISATAARLAAERDAARYRWLRVQEDISIAACWLLPIDHVCARAKAPPEKSIETPEELDVALDAAIDAAGRK